MCRAGRSPVPRVAALLPFPPSSAALLGFAFRSSLSLFPMCGLSQAVHVSCLFVVSALHSASPGGRQRLQPSPQRPQGWTLLNLAAVLLAWPGQPRRLPWQAATAPVERLFVYPGPQAHSCGVCGAWAKPQCLVSKCEGLERAGHGSCGFCRQRSWCTALAAARRRFRTGVWKGRDGESPGPLRLFGFPSAAPEVGLTSTLFSCTMVVGACPGGSCCSGQGLRGCEEVLLSRLREPSGCSHVDALLAQ